MCDKQIEGLCHHHGQLIGDELYTDSVEGLDQTCYYVEMDGSMMLTRAQEQQPGEQSGGWKEIKLLIAIGDGAHWIREFWSEHYPQAVQILDLYHVVERLGVWARLLWGDSQG